MNWKKRFLKLGEGFYIPIDDIAWTQIMTAEKYAKKYQDFSEKEIEYDDGYLVVFFQKPIQEKDGKPFRGSWTTGLCRTKKEAIDKFNKIWGQK